MSAELPEVIATKLIYNLTRGLNNSDELAEPYIFSSFKVSQGCCVYEEYRDYLILSNSIRWVTGGNSPSPGSRYTVEHVWRDD